MSGDGKQLHVTSGTHLKARWLSGSHGTLAVRPRSGSCLEPLTWCRVTLLPEGWQATDSSLCRPSRSQLTAHVSSFGHVETRFLEATIALFSFFFPVFIQPLE